MIKNIIVIALIVLIVILLLLQNIGTYVQMPTIRNNSQYANIEVKLSGDGKAIFTVSNNGIEAETFGNADINSQFYLEEIPTSCATCEQIVPTFTSVPKSLHPASMQLIPTSTPEPFSIQVFLTGSSMYNVRQCPSVSCKVEDIVYPGDDINAYEKNSDGTWVRIDTGWLSTENILLDENINLLPVASFVLTPTSQPIATNFQILQPTILTTPTPMGFEYIFTQTDQYALDNDSYNMVRFWVYVHNDNIPTKNISFAVTHNGILQVPTNQDEFISQDVALQTWSYSNSNKQRLANAKLEFNITGSALGKWTLTPRYNGLATNVGVIIGPTIGFEITQEDINNKMTEFFVEYQKN